MKLPLILIAVASGALSSGCASNVSTPATVTRPVPWECVAHCQEPAPMVLHRQAWETETLSRFLSCRKLHSDCVEALKP